MKTLVLDLDGTMYRGTKIIDSAKKFIDLCVEKKVPYVFLTNNSMRTREENAEHMQKMGYEHITSDMFFNSAMASAKYARKYLKGNKACFIGKNGMRQALLDEGFELVEQQPDFVFIGLNKDMTYDGYSAMLHHLLQGAKLIGTNDDRILAKEDGFEVGNGSVVKLFEYATGQTSPKIAKPHTPILDLCLEYFGLKKDEIILVGDNLETDIALGYNTGVETFFVETGVHQREDIEKIGVKPTHIGRDLLEFDWIWLENNE
ncbi:TIGR01457 family HAD hydrolase [Firmicutes bacterium M10-2]|nr:TIGR01457 family HAD hydrolase [Firmicutes bacterium M10-2]